MTAPLAGLRVIDLTEGDGAPFAAMQLGDAGADVIKVEPPGGDWARPLGPPFDDQGDGPLFLGMNRNKRSLVVDLEQPAGQQIVRRLAEEADILIHSFPRAGDAARYGLDYAALSERNPRLTYCDLSLLERTGPEADRPATDLTLQGRTGITRFVGERGVEPLRFGTNYAGVTAAMYAVQGILAAVFHRWRSGQGQRVQTSYLRAMIATQQNYLTAFSDPDGTSRGFFTAHLEPPYRGWPTADRRIDFSLGYARTPDAIERFLQTFGLREKLDADPGWAGRTVAPSDVEALRPHIEDAFRRHTCADLLRMIDELGFMCAPVNDYDSLLTDPGVLQQDAVVQVAHPVRGTVRTTGLPWKLTATPGSIRRAPPLLGEHTDEVLAECEYRPDEIAALRADGVVA